MASVCFTPKEMITDLNRLAQEAAKLQSSVEKNRCCGSYLLKKEFSILKASFAEKIAILNGDKSQAREDEKMDGKMAEAAEKARQALDGVQIAFDKQAGNWDFRISSQISSWTSQMASTRIGSSIAGISTRFFAYFNPRLTAEQTALVEEFIHSEKSNWELNQKIVRDIAVVRELIRRNAFLRKEDDRDSSLLIALTQVYHQLEAFNFEAGQKNSSLLESPQIKDSSDRMKSKLRVLDLLLKTQKWTSNDGFYFIEHCLLKDCTVFLNRIIKKKNLLPLAPERQLTLWLDVSSQDGAQFLKNLGSDPNIRHDGRTPLIELAMRGYSYPLSSAILAKILMRAGADPKATAIINGVERRARDLTLDPYLKSVLQSEQKEELKSTQV